MAGLEWLSCNYEEVAKDLKDQTSPKLEAAQQEQILKSEMEKCKLVAELGGENVTVEQSSTRKVIIEPTYNPNAIREVTPNTRMEASENIQPIWPDWKPFDFKKKESSTERTKPKIDRNMPNLYDAAKDNSKWRNLYKSQ